MKIIILIIIMTCIQQNTSFCQISLKDVLNSRYKDSPYVVFKIEYQGKSKDIFMPNNDLFYHHGHQLGLRGENYDSTMTEMIQTNTAFKVNRKVWLFFSNYVIRYDKKVDSISLRGKEYFIDFYFRNRGSLKIMKTDISSHSSRGFIVKKLFEWGVYVETDDLSGQLIILERNRRERVE